MAERGAIHTVGVVGLGSIGAPITRHLLGAGYDVWCADLVEEKVAPLVERGASVASNAAGLAGPCQLVLLTVPTDDDVLTVGKSLVASAESETVVAICSSVRPETCQRLASLAGGGRVAVLDVALTGGVRAAEAGQLNLLVGGSPDDLEHVRPTLTTFSVHVHHLGPLGAGQVGKTVNNLVHWTQIAGLVEALSLGARLGVPASRMRGALASGSTNSRTLHELEQMRLTWHAKDLGNALQMAESAGAELPVARRVREAMPEITVSRIAELLGSLSDNDAKQTIIP